jgi:hypothetical protein
MDAIDRREFEQWNLQWQFTTSLQNAKLSPLKIHQIRFIGVYAIQIKNTLKG